MERNIDDFLKDPEQQNRLDSLTVEEFYQELEDTIYEAVISGVAPFANHQITNTGDTKLEPLTRNKATRDYAYGGKSSTVVKRSDKIELSKNKDLNITKSTIRAAFKAIIAASNKTELGSQITNMLRQTEKRLFQQIDQKLKAEERK
jgi:hypothetical protein